MDDVAIANHDDGRRFRAPVPAFALIIHNDGISASQALASSPIATIRFVAGSGHQRSALAEPAPLTTS